MTSACLPEHLSSTPTEVAKPSAKVQDAIQKLIRDESAKAKAAAFAKAISEWDAPRLAAERLFERYASPI
jgi:UDP:flavonoid glycosyltransferase YjiC (YdhE family)